MSTRGFVGAEYGLGGWWWGEGGSDYCAEVCEGEPWFKAVKQTTAGSGGGSGPAGGSECGSCVGWNRGDPVGKGGP